MGKHFRPEKTYIYLLRCPIDNSPKYVGKSNDPNKRKDGHKSKSKTKDNPLSKWIRELNENNLKPIVEIIEEVDYSKWIEREKFYVKKYREDGHDLKNVNNGSNGLSGPNQTSFKKGRKSETKGTGGQTNVCVICSKEFRRHPSRAKKQSTCSKSCGGLLSTIKQSETRGIEKIVQLTESVEFVSIYDNRADAARKNNICSVIIRARVKGLTKRPNLPYGGYIWMTESQYNKFKNDK